MAVQILSYHAFALYRVKSALQNPTDGMGLKGDSMPSEAFARRRGTLGRSPTLPVNIRPPTPGTLLERALSTPVDFLSYPLPFALSYIDHRQECDEFMQQAFPYLLKIDSPKP